MVTALKAGKECREANVRAGDASGKRNCVGYLKEFTNDYQTELSLGRYRDPHVDRARATTGPNTTHHRLMLSRPGLLRVLWLLSLTLSPSAAMTLMAHHLLILGLLISIQNRFDLAASILADLLHLAHAILLRK